MEVSVQTLNTAAIVDRSSSLDSFVSPQLNPKDRIVLS